jgi:hypothetical protein
MVVKASMGVEPRQKLARDRVLSNYPTFTTKVEDLTTWMTQS